MTGGVNVTMHPLPAMGCCCLCCRWASKVIPTTTRCCLRRCSAARWWTQGLTAHDNGNDEQSHLKLRVHYCWWQTRRRGKAVTDVYTGRWRPARVVTGLITKRRQFKRQWMTYSWAEHSPQSICLTFCGVWRVRVGGRGASFLNGDIFDAIKACSTILALGWRVMEYVSFCFT